MSPIDFSIGSTGFHRICGALYFSAVGFQVLDLRFDNSGLPDEIRPELT